MRKIKLLNPVLLPVTVSLTVTSCCLLTTTNKPQKKQMSNALKSVKSKANFISESDIKSSNEEGERIHNNFNPKNSLALLSDKSRFQLTDSGYTAEIDFGVNIDYINAALMYTAVNYCQTSNTGKVTDNPIASTEFLGSSQFINLFPQIGVVYKRCGKDNVIDLFKKAIIDGKLFIYPIGGNQVADIKAEKNAPHKDYHNAAEDLFPVFNYKIWNKENDPDHKQYLLTNLWDTYTADSDFDSEHNIAWLIAYGPQTYSGFDPFNLDSWKELISRMPTLKWAETAKKYPLSVSSASIPALDLTYENQTKVDPRGSIACQVNELLLQNIQNESTKINVDLTDYTEKFDPESTPRPSAYKASSISMKEIMNQPTHRTKLATLSFENKDDCIAFCQQNEFYNKRISVSSTGSFHYFSPFFNDFFVTSDKDNLFDDYSKLNGINAHQIYSTEDPWKTPDIRSKIDPTKTFTPVLSSFDSVSGVEYNIPVKENIVRRTIIKDGSDVIASLKIEKETITGEKYYEALPDTSDLENLPTDYQKCNEGNLNLFLYAQSPEVVSSFINNGILETKIGDYTHWGKIVAVDKDDNPIGTAVPFTIEMQSILVTPSISETGLLEYLTSEQGKNNCSAISVDNKTIKFKYSLPNKSETPGSYTDLKKLESRVSDFAKAVVMEPTLNHCDETPTEIYEPYGGLYEQGTAHRNNFLSNRINYSDTSSKRTALFDTSFTSTELAPDPEVKPVNYDPKIYDKDKWKAAGFDEGANPSIFPKVYDGLTVIAGPYSCGVEDPGEKTGELTIHYNNPNRVCQTLSFETFSVGMSPYIYAQYYDEGEATKTYTYVDFRFEPEASTKTKVQKVGDSAQYRYKLGESLNEILNSESPETSRFSIDSVDLNINFNSSAMSDNRDLIDDKNVIDSFEMSSNDKSWISGGAIWKPSLLELKEANMLISQEEAGKTKWYLDLSMLLKKEHLTAEVLEFTFTLHGIDRNPGEQKQPKQFEIYCGNAWTEVEPVQIEFTKPIDSYSRTDSKCLKEKGDWVSTNFEITSTFSQRYVDPSSTSFVLNLSGGEQVELTPEKIETDELVTGKYKLLGAEGSKYEGKWLYTLEFTRDVVSNDTKTSYTFKVIQETSDTIFGHIVMNWKVEGVQSELSSDFYPTWYCGEPKPEPIPPTPPPGPDPVPTSWWTIPHILGVINIPICLAGIGFCTYSINQHKKHKNDHDYDN